MKTCQLPFPIQSCSKENDHGVDGFSDPLSGSLDPSTATECPHGVLALAVPLAERWRVQRKPIPTPNPTLLWAT